MKRKPSVLKLKIDLRPGAKLSAHYNNRQDCYKVVETDNVLGYVVSGGSRGGAAAIYPLYRADLHMKRDAVWHMISSYEMGSRLNDYTFLADYQGCTLAAIAAQAIAALEERRRVPQIVQQAAAKKRQGSRRTR